MFGGMASFLAAMCVRRVVLPILKKRIITINCIYNNNNKTETVR